mgnify:CR=1 FL=1
MINISRESEINLINILIDQDIISGKDLVEIKKISGEGEKSQLDAVFELNLTDEEKILDLLVKDQSLDVVDLSTVAVTDELKAVLPSNYINMNFIAPFKIEGKVLHIAISDISKLSLMRNLRTITKMDIELHAAKVSDISNFVDKLLADGERTISDIRQTNAEKTKTFDYDVDDQAEVLEKPPEEDIEAIENESEVIKFSTAVVAEAIKSGVSDIHIEPYRFTSRVRYRLDGILQEQEHFKKFLHSNYGAVVTRFKIMGKLDIAERRLPQDGAIPFKIDGKVVDLRLSILPTATNERIVMRVLNKDAGDISLEQLNFEDTDLKILRKAIHSTQGLVLVTGPTGSGKSTTLAAIVNEINKTRTSNIITVEDPVEFIHKDVKSIVSHREVGKQTQSFAAALKAALREDPDVILVGEMRDLETISLALTAAETGHLVFGTLHTSGAPSTINRIIDVFPPEQQEQIRAQISTSLKMVVTQRLLKTRDGAGRVGAFEIMKCTAPIQNLIREAKIHQIPSIMQTAVRDGMITMEKSLEELVKSGKIDPGAARSGH